MNAQGIKDENHLDQLISNPNYAAQEKLDGMRAIIHICKDGLRIFSRSAGVEDPTRPLEKTSSLPHLAEMKFPDLAGTILDAEILAPGVDVFIYVWSDSFKTSRPNERICEGIRIRCAKIHWR